MPDWLRIAGPAGVPVGGIAEVTFNTVKKAWIHDPVSLLMSETMSWAGCQLSFLVAKGLEEPCGRLVVRFNGRF